MNTTSTAEGLPAGRFSALRVPTLPEDTDTMTAAFAYVKAGLYIGPLEQGSKHPGSVLGGVWQSKTFNDAESVAAWYAGTSHGAFLHAGRSGLVILDVDRPERVPEEWWPILATAPFQSTRSTDTRKGHYLFAMPEGRTIGNPNIPGGAGEVRGANGVIVVAPTRHEKAEQGGRYQWVRTGPVPYLPPLIADVFPDSKPGERSVTSREVQAFIAENAHEDPDAERFKGQPIQRFLEKVEKGESRHGAAVSAAAWIAKEAAAGWYRADEMFDTLQSAFLGTLTPRERDVEGRGSRTEWDGILSWAIGQVRPEDVEFKREQLDGKRNVAYLSHYREPDDEESSPVPDAHPGDDQESEKPSEEAGQFRNGGRGRDGRRRIHTGTLADSAVYLRHEMGRNELAGLFMRGGQLVHTPRIGEDGYTAPKPKDPSLADKTTDGPAQIRPVTDAGLTVMVESRYDVGKVAETQGIGEGAKPVKRWNRGLLPKQLVARMVGGALQGEDTPNLRPLNAVTHTPTMRPDGTIHDAPGYDDATGTLYLPTDAQAAVAVPQFPTAEQVAAAREMVLYPISQFPFVSDDDMANWVGAALTPVLRPMLPGPYQFLVIEAPSPGSGKGFLLGILGAAHGVAMRPGIPTKDEEWSKVVMTLLSTTTAPIVAFDNVRGVVHSSVLEGLLTSKVVADRVLGKNTESMSLPNDRLWCMTGNNAQLGGDLARRTLRVTIDPGMENPEARTGFRCQPVQWVEERRAEYVAALLTIARAWVAAGRPMGATDRSDDYATWVRTVRGIMEFAGFPGTFSNSSERKEVSTEDAEWSRFLEAVEDALGDREFTARELYSVISSPTMPEQTGRISADFLPGDLSERHSFGQEAKFITSLGLWLKNRTGRYAGGRVIQSSGTGTSGARKNRVIYRVQRADGTVPDASAGHGGASCVPFPRTAPGYTGQPAW
jgi:hypothetical protein